MNTSLRAWLLIVLLLSLGNSTFADESQLRVMTWNIWNGGREDGEQIGPERVVDVIRESKADVVALQETYGSGKRISDSLGFHFLERGTNVSIHSRFPVLEDISVFEAFKCVGALIELPDGQKLAFYNIWLPYGEDIWLPGVRAKRSTDQLQAACQPSADDLKTIRDAIVNRLSDAKYRGTSIIIAGDFNSMSHNDYSDVSTDQFQQRIDWKTSHVLVDAGFRDSYREANRVVNRSGDSTWSPRFPEQEQDRIDFIYYQSSILRTAESRVIKHHPERFPSDHAAVMTSFEIFEQPPAPLSIKAMTYNIRHGQGTDNRLALDRTAAVIKEQAPDFVGLQEVDFNATRSKKVNQAAQLGKALNMHAAFGSFMDFQGGRYGMGVLSRFPIKSTTSLELPMGNEPRVALAVEVMLPNDRTIVIVNVHFDWVNDDGFRFQQASTLRKYLDELDVPYVLLGDFNDERQSRTLEILSRNCVEAVKPHEDRFTWSSTDPSNEIDFIFASPQTSWEVKAVKVIDEPIASDHRPVIADLNFK
jgi:endonuclease/exonuclease/phosphatase family metal-dependent hydrolase